MCCAYLKCPVKNRLIKVAHVARKDWIDHFIQFLSFICYHLYELLHGLHDFKQAYYHTGIKWLALVRLGDIISLGYTISTHSFVVFMSWIDNIISAAMTSLPHESSIPSFPCFCCAWLGPSFWYEILVPVSWSLVVVVWYVTCFIPYCYSNCCLFGILIFDTVVWGTGRHPAHKKSQYRLFQQFPKLLLGTCPNLE